MRCFVKKSKVKVISCQAGWDAYGMSSFTASGLLAFALIAKVYACTIITVCYNVLCMAIKERTTHMKFTYKHTLYASYIGYITQAIINNLPPLLFVTFQKEFGLSLEQIGLLVSFNFGIQLFTDLVAVKYVDRIGYRTALVIAHILSFVGLVSFTILPFVLANAYVGLLLPMMICAVGGGLNEVLISPVVEALPGDEKASAMSLLHSFYCWGHVAVVVLTTVFFLIAGTGSWRYLPVLWSSIPFFNLFLFAKVPIKTLVEEGEKTPVRKLFLHRFFWLFLVLMVCSGASEQAMSQWSSLFAELGLGVSKTLGDLLGPCAFALFMGLIRAFYGVKGSKINLKKMLIFSGVLCITSYLVTVFSPFPVLSLVGCALCGFSVGMMWPGTFSLSSQYFPRGGTAMFALLALAGDLGCSAGPGVVGFISNAVQKQGAPVMLSWIRDVTEAGLKTGLLVAVLFPLILLIGVIVIAQKGEGERNFVNNRVQE